MTRLPLAALLALALLAPVATDAVASSPASAAPDLPTVVITLFYGEGCPHCTAEKQFLADLVEREPQVAVAAYEVWYNEANLRLFVDVAAAHGLEASGVPGTFVAGRAWIGFSRGIGDQIEAVVQAELARTAEPTPQPSAEPTAQPTTPAGPTPTTPAGPTPRPPPEPTPGPSPAAVIDVPLIGPIDLGDQSLLVGTALIALVDGFNPCSLWVLSVLLAMMLHSGSRRRVLAVGSVFLLTAGAAYGAFMVGIYGVVGLIGYLGWIQVVVGAIVLVFAVLAIKDYFWFGRGPSLSIPERHKPRIYRDSRRLMDADRPIAAVLGATVLLAAGVALIELPCTAGLPVLWSGMLADRAVAALEFGLLLGLYLAIYLLDEALLLGSVLVTMRASRMQEQHGRALKLVAGCVMLALALVMILAPETLYTISGTLAVFGVALGAALLIILAEHLRPRLGARARSAEGR